MKLYLEAAIFFHPKPIAVGGGLGEDGRKSLLPIISWWKLSIITEMEIVAIFF
ncbi:MAG: hypothetical protein ACE5GI_07770 [Candidatus Aminicenantales bacterium]